MKKLLNRFKAMVALGLAACFSLADKASEVLNVLGDRALGVTKPFALRRQGGFVTLNRSYGGYPAGSTVEFNASTEAALIAGGTAVASSAATASAAPNNTYTTTQNSGNVTLPATSLFVVIQNPSIGPQSLVWAQIVGLSVDATATSIARINPVNGQVSIVANAAATGPVSIDWAILNPTGSLTFPT